MPDVVVGDDRAQHLRQRRGEQRSSVVGTADVTDLPGAGGIRAVDVEQFEFDRHVVLAEPDLRHLRERADPLTERLRCREPLHADHVEVEARRPHGEPFEQHVERLADLEADVVHELLVGHRDDVVVEIGTIGEEVAEQRTRRQAGQERSSGSQRDDPVVIDGRPECSMRR